MLPPTASHPLQQRYLSHADGTLTLPHLDYLNRRSEATGIQTGGGFPLRFECPNQQADYEQRAFRSGVVATRPNNWHDAFNALVWLTFPLSKRALNSAHVQARSTPTGEGNQRGKLRDSLTQFDECGVIVAGTSPALWQAICRHEWVEAFVSNRSELQATTRFIVFGHGSLDALRAPFVGLCGKAIFLEIAACDLVAIDADDLQTVDADLARRVASTNWQESSCLSLQPLPLLGIPGATTDNEHADYYRDQRQFRPRR